MVRRGVKIHTKMSAGDGCFLWSKNDILISFTAKDACKSKNTGKISARDLRKVVFFENLWDVEIGLIWLFASRLLDS